MSNLKNLTLLRRDQLLKSAFLPVEQNQEQQRLDLLNLVQFARNNNRFYRKFFPSDLDQQDSLPEILNKLPTMNRRLLQDKFDSLETYIPGADEKRYGLSFTSGSTGQPVKVSKYWPEYIRELFAITLVEWDWCQRDLNKLIGFFRVGIKDNPQLELTAPFDYLGDTTMSFEYRSDNRSLDELAKVLVERKPNYLYCNGITLRLLAKEFVAGNYPRVNIEEILTVSDPISADFRQLMFDAFGARTVDRYSTEEFGILALQCPSSDHMHIVAPNFIIEVLDEQNQSVSTGAVGRILITWLANRAMPIVRYDLGDLVRLDYSCPAGITWPAVSEVVGRVRDYVTWQDGTTTIATFVMSKVGQLPDLYDYSCILFKDTVLFVAGVKSQLSENSQEIIREELLRIFGPGLKRIVWQTHKLPLLRMHKRPEFFKLDQPYLEGFNPVEFLEQVSNNGQNP